MSTQRREFRSGEIS